MYLITRDGFTVLTLGFTGKKVMKWKEKYIVAFNPIVDTQNFTSLTDMHIPNLPVILNKLDLLENKLDQILAQGGV